MSDSSALKLNVLVVDDETNIRKTLSYCLTRDDHSVIAVSNYSDALSESKCRSFDLAFIDLKLGDENGLALVPELLTGSPWMKIVVITAYASIETAVEAMKMGAVDYIEKPFTPDQIRFLAKRIIKMRQLEMELDTLRANVRQLGPDIRLNSNNTLMQRTIDIARRAAASDAIILLMGESGTGKSVLARAIHGWSNRRGKPFSVISCPSVPDELLESELFGHARGAFTGAIKDNPGRIAACEGGTLLLDEIGDLTPHVQAKLLRFIQDKEYERLGESTVRKADVRIVVATNVDLEQRMKQGDFREDLYYRLNVIAIVVPPLRERPEDVLQLSEDFLSYFRKSNNKSIHGFSQSAEQLLVQYHWPGNVRELRNTIERAVILKEGELIDSTDLPQQMKPGLGSIQIGDPVALATIEEQHIRRILATSGSLQEAADILGIDQATLWRRRKSYGI